VKTWALRGTLHLLPAAELSLWITGLGTRIERHFLNRARQKWFGFEREEALELIAAIGEALDGRELTRAELAALEQPLVADRGAALAEVTRRYLGAAGPATREDLARWWGGAPAEGGRMLNALGDEVAPVTVAGAPRFLRREHVARRRTPSHRGRCDSCRASTST